MMTMSAKMTSTGEEYDGGKLEYMDEIELLTSAHIAEKPHRSASYAVSDEEPYTSRDRKSVV